MPRLLAACLTAIAALALASAASAQNVLVVAPVPGPGVFSTDVQTAVDAALDGDLVLVKAGTYPGFTITTKSLSVVADTGAAVSIQGPVVVTGLAIPQRAQLSGLSIATPYPVTKPGLWIRSNAGGVWVERTTSLGGNGNPGVRIDSSSSVSLQRGTFTGGLAAFIAFAKGGDGVRVTGSFVALHDVSARGGTGSTGGGPGSISGGGGAGANLLDGSIFASGCTFSGGNGGSNSLPGPGGAGLSLAGPATALECSELGGAGGQGGLSNGPPGAAVDDPAFLTTLAGFARHLLAPEPTRALAPATISVKGLPGEQVGVLYATTYEPGFLLAGFDEVLFLLTPSVNGLVLGVIPISGTLDVPLATPSLPPAALGTTVFMQCVHFDAPLTYAVLGPPGAWTILDSSL